MMDKLDIFALPFETKVITTAEEICRVYHTGFNDGMEWERTGINTADDEGTVIHGDIV